MIKLFRFLKPYSLTIAVILLLVFFQSLAELFLPTLMADIVDEGIVLGNIELILRTGGIMLLVALGGVICTILGSYFASRTAMSFGKILRSKVFTHVQAFTLHEFDQIGTASLITRTTNDINQVQMVLLMILRMMVHAPLMFVGGVIMALSRDVQLSKSIVVVIPLIALTITIIMVRAIPLFKAMQLKLDRLNLVLRENLTGIRVIRAFNQIAQEKKRLSEANQDLTETTIRVNKLIAVTMPVLMLSLNFTAIAVVWFGSARIDSGNLQVGDLMAFLQYVMLILFSLVMVTIMLVMIPRASVSAERINQVLDTVPSIKDPAAVKAGKESGRKGYVEFANVTFSYPGAEKPALKNLSFSAGPGEVTALIGSTGSGKSTIFKLLLRFYDPDSGNIAVNGIDIGKLPQKDLRAWIGFVPQNTLLFSGTVTENIRFGKQDATSEEIYHAATLAQAVDFIEELPGRFEAIIDQGGANLSGGQKQRLAIARALVRKPEIYIFDDSFSSLDFKTDARLRSALDQETANATVFIITQRVSTVSSADRIIVLDDGCLSGIGNHQELLDTSAVYREIVYSQLSEEEIV
ncbi:MAG: ABC transporter ATP-binding protein [Firmicutes bacterium]|nr:ABC transporter ATP-binding protein [Bacillota bacterium]